MGVAIYLTGWAVFVAVGIVLTVYSTDDKEERMGEIIAISFGGCIWFIFVAILVISSPFMLIYYITSQIKEKQRKEKTHAAG